jgi:hypothetical protein
MDDAFGPAPAPTTLREAVALLRRAADWRDAWAETTAATVGEKAVVWARIEAANLRSAALIVENGDAGPYWAPV